MKGQPRISPVYRLGQPAPAADPIAQWSRVEGLRRRAWREHGLVAVSAAELPAELREPLTRWMEAQYG